MQPRHIVQSEEWAQFKNTYGTPTIKCGDIYYSKHKIPLSPLYMAYCPKVNPFLINWEEIKKSLEQEKCIAIRFDVPNITQNDEEYEKALNIFNKYCQKAPASTFAQHTILIDLTKSEEEILRDMHPKHRYNIKIAYKHNIEVKIGTNAKDFDDFFELFQKTAIRQKYYIRPKNYYQTLWNILAPKNMCHILIAKYNNHNLASWMLLNYSGVLYYPYGGSSDKHQNYFPNNLIGWEAIKLGKELNCKIFDMWGATNEVQNKNHPWWGFTNFKLKFGGTLVSFIDSYDLVLNPSAYKTFNLINDIRWKVLKFLR